MPTIINAGKTFIVCPSFNNEGWISLGFNEDGTIRRYEDGKLIKEFSSLNEYSDWVRENRPEEWDPIFRDIQ